jgi:hypothetical protein
MIGSVISAAGVPSVSRRCGGRPWRVLWATSGLPRCNNDQGTIRHRARLRLLRGSWPPPQWQLPVSAHFHAIQIAVMVATCGLRRRRMKRRAFIAGIGGAATSAALWPRAASGSNLGAHCSPQHLQAKFIGLR